MKKKSIFRYSLCLVLCLILLISVIPLPSRAVDDTWINNAAKELRKTMVDRVGEINFTYESESWMFSPEAFGNDPAAQAALGAEVNLIMERIYQLAIAHTGAGNEGDYLRWHLKSCEEGFTYGYIQEGNQAKDFVYTFRFTLTYYTTKNQEDAVSAKVQSVLSQLNLAGKTDYEKIKAIYDYLCDNVVYDNANLNNQSYDLKYSAYAALINGTSVCQGYSNLLYRMALEAGVDCRFIFGQSQGGNHSWNIVKLDGVYYNVDATWDAVTKDHRYFLKTDAHMDDHTKDPEYSQPAFMAAHPLASSDYAIPGGTGSSGNSGNSGGTGNSGNTGNEGSAGNTGNTGNEGSAGNTGSTGNEGSSGNTGNSGDQQPDTTPTVPQEQNPPTEPATEPATQPSTQAPSQPPATTPSGQPSVGVVEPSSTGGTAPAESANAPKPTEKPHSPDDAGPNQQIWLLAAGGVACLSLAVGLAVLIGRKKK